MTSRQRAVEIALLVGLALFTLFWTWKHNAFLAICSVVLAGVVVGARTYAERRYPR